MSPSSSQDLPEPRSSEDEDQPSQEVQDTLDHQSSRLKQATTLTKEVSSHPQAKEQFEALYQQIKAENGDHAELLKQLWEELMISRRSAIFWQEMSDVEKAMSDSMAQANIQLKQNYLRLVQEQ